MERKYELLKDDTIDVYGHTLYRIRALRNFGDVKAGDLGGYIEKEDNLSHGECCWVSDNARAYGNAKVFGNAWVSDDARVSDNARVSGNARVYGHVLVSNYAEVFDNAQVYGNARVYHSAQIFDNAWVCGNAVICNNAVVSSNAKVSGNAKVSVNARVYGHALVSVNAYVNSTDDYICIGPIGSRNGYTTFYLTRDKNIMVNCGCFNDTLEEFIKAVNETHKYNEKYKKQYIDAVKYAVEYLKDDKGGN